VTQVIISTAALTDGAVVKCTVCPHL